MIRKAPLILFSAVIALVMLMALGDSRAIGGGVVTQGNVDCSTTGNAVSSVDALKILRFSANLSVQQTEPCPDIGTAVGSFIMGNVDCSAPTKPSSVDALKILRFSANLSVTYTEPCPHINTPLVDPKPDLFAIDTDPTGNGNRVEGGIGPGDAGEGDMDGPGCLDDGNPANGVGLGEDDDQDGITDEGCPVLGTIENCARINENGMQDADEDAVDTLFIDVIAKGIKPTNRLLLFSFDLTYTGSPNSIKVSGAGVPAQPDGTPAGVASDPRYLLFAEPDSGNLGSQFLDQPNETDVTADGFWSADDLDSTLTDPRDATEDGDGVLNRIRIQSVATAVTGVYSLDLENAYMNDQTNFTIFPTTITGANISINTACTPPS